MYLIKQGFKKGNTNNNMYFKIDENGLPITIVYVDYLIFDWDDEKLSHMFVVDMEKKFEMSMIRELSFFLGLQISQTLEGIFIS